MKVIVACLLFANGLTFAQNFDAASVKPSGDFVPGVLPVMSGGPGTNDPGRITYTRRTLLALVMQAWDLERDQVFGPTSLKDPVFFDLTATMPPDTTKERFQAMLQNLLIARFHIKLHHESRDFPGYELQIADKGPRLKETVHGDEEAEPGILKPLFNPDGSAKLRPGPQSVTMSNRNSMRVYYQAKPLSDLIRQLGGFINSSMGAKDGAPVPRIVDKTSLTGKYDFSIEFDCEGCVGLAAMMRNLPAFAGRGGDAPAPQEAAPDPGSGLPNIFAAIEKQLGLKLVKVKDIPTDVVVIDQSDKVPSEN